MPPHDDGHSGAYTHVGGVRFAVSTVPEAATRTLKDALDADRRSGISIRFSNAYCVALAADDPDYRAALNSTGVTFPDGKPVAWAMRSRWFGATPSAQQVRGPSFFPHVLEQGIAKGARHYFFGGTDETLLLLLEKLNQKLPDLVTVGASSPAFSNDIPTLVDQLPASVNRDTTDILWVALGTPKQDYVANAIAERTGLVVAAVGAAFDFTAGTVREAPAWVRRIGMEWLYRLASEPRRLWRRYLIGNVQFVRALVRARFSG